MLYFMCFDHFPTSSLASSSSTVAGSCGWKDGFGRTLRVRLLPALFPTPFSAVLLAHLCVLTSIAPHDSFPRVRTTVLCCGAGGVVSEEGVNLFAWQAQGCLGQCPAPSSLFAVCFAD